MPSSEYCIYNAAVWVIFKVPYTISMVKNGKKYFFRNGAGMSDDAIRRDKIH